MIRILNSNFFTQYFFASKSSTIPNFIQNKILMRLRFLPAKFSLFYVKLFFLLTFFHIYLFICCSLFSAQRYLHVFNNLTRHFNSNLSEHSICCSQNMKDFYRKNLTFFFQVLAILGLGLLVLGICRIRNLDIYLECPFVRVIMLVIYFF